MKAMSIWMTLWRTTAAAQRWAMLALVALVWVASAAYAVHADNSSACWTAAVISAYADFFASLTLLAPLLLLAVDARHLRVPGMQRSAVLGLALYAAILVAIPTCMLVMAGGERLGIFAVQLLGLMGGFTLGLLPRYFAALLGFAPVLFNVFKPHFDAPHAGSTTLFGIAACVAVLGCIAAWCWRYQMHVADPYRQGFGKPLVMVRSSDLSRQGWPGWFAPRDSAGQLRTMPAWMQPVADMHRAGPAHVAYSLRIALGGWLLPMTWQSRLMRWAMVLVPVPALMFLGVASAGMSLRHFVEGVIATFGVWVWVVGFAGASLSLVVAMLLHQRWRRANADLALLALLPGLGHGRPLLLNLLRACMQRVLCIQGVLLAVLLAVALHAHVDMLSLSIAVLGQLAGAGFALAYTLCNIGGVRLPIWSPGLAAGICYVLVGLDNVCMPFFTHAPALGGPAQLVLISAWIALIIVLAILAWRGWRGVQRRPHPFLAARA